MSYTPSRWKLDDLMPAQDPASIEKAAKAVERQVKKIEAWRPELKASMPAARFKELLKEFETLYRLGVRVNYFAALRFFADTQDQAALALMSQMEDRFARAQNRVLFFSLWFKQLDDRNAERLMRAAGDARYWLEEMRRFKPHTLSEAEEKVINLKDVNGANALQTVYETITNKFTFKLEVDGVEQTLTRDALMVHVRSSNPDLRAAAYSELYRVYSEHAPVLAQIYGHLVRDWHSENVDLRGFKRPIAVRNLQNDIPDAVVETLLKVIGANAGVFQRYFRLKAKWIGMERLRRYDLYAPLAKAEKEFPYDDAVNMVLDAFTDFSPQVGDMARSVFDADHVDAEVRPGKRGGAFCASAQPDLPPWVLVNYNNRANDVATLAHEMGHAIHSLLAAEHSIFTFQSGLPLAETASVFSEMVVTEKLLAEETDPAVRRQMLATVIDDTYATVGRQGFFAMWEKEAHDLARQGKTADEMAQAYLQVLKDQFGDSVVVSDDFRWEWVVIPHFYSTPFYVYAYAFGQLLVLALYQMYKREGEAFKPKYLRLLAHGGSASPEAVLTEAGINMRSAKFWQGGFDVISGMIDELEALE